MRPRIAFRRTDPVGKVVAAAPATSSVFERHGIDPEAGAEVSLARACRARGLDVAPLVAELEAVAAAHAGEDDPLLGPALSVLVDHILRRHHAFARAEIPRLTALLDAAATAHAAEHPNLFPPLLDLWRRFAEDFETHMRQEEEVLFPAVRAAVERGRPGLRCGNLDGPVLRAEWLHEEQSSELDRMRRIAGGFVAPAGASDAWRDLYAGLAAFERDLREHVHLENDVLFPRVRALGLPPRP